MKMEAELFNCFEDVRDIRLECCEALLVEFNATRAGFFHVGDHLADFGDEELGLYVAEGLEDVPAMSHFGVCVPYNKLGQDSFLGVSEGLRFGIVNCNQRHDRHHPGIG